MRALLAPLLLLVPVTASAQRVPPAATASRVIDSLARAFLADSASPSVAIAVVRGRDTLAMRAWGTADLELGVAATPRSVYRIGSVTKQFTAAAVMQLVEQGKVQLDDSIATWLPTLPLAWRGVTVRQLLNHTSGIPSYTDIGKSWVRRWGEEMTPDTLVALTANAPMWFAPGSNWRYDNTGYVVLGMLIEKVTGRSWGADLEARFTIPLGLTSTRNCLNDPIIKDRVRGYSRDKSGWGNAPYLAMSQPFSAGALCSTIGDLTKWNRALHTGKVVSAASYQLMITPTGPAATSELKYGFGLGVDSIAGRVMISHGGGIHGFITGNVWIPSAELSITVLTNSGSAPAGVLLRQLARAALGVPLDRPPVAIPLPASARAQYAGVYALDVGGTLRDLTIAIDGDHLTVQLAGQGANPLIYFGNHTFGANFDKSFRLTFTVDGGRATKVATLQGGRRLEGVRK
jgi:CubicO group peptidase (beta-lactamase class C family)